MSVTTYPVHVDAELDPGLSRWLWLIKWVLAIPHFVVLAFLWIGFVVLSVVAFFAILFTGRYPRSIFEFNVGVLRWSWRVAYYAYGALGTDRYPPFTLHEVAEYPAHLEVEYPEHLSRGLVLIKWWLLAIPHYLVVNILLGGAGFVVRQAVDEPVGCAGLIGLLVLVAGVVLLCTGRYPQPLFDLILGLNRWVLRVAGYAGLMTDQYPPFGLDQGGHEGDERRGSPVVIDPPASLLPASTMPATTVSPTSPPAAGPSGWTSGRVVSLVVGVILAVVAVLTGMVGIGLGVADLGARDDGFMMSNTQSMATPTYAIASSNLQIHMDGSPGSMPRSMPRSMIGDATLTASSQNAKDVFLGIGPTSQVQAYLARVSHATLVDVTDGAAVLRVTDGATPASMPEESDFWVAQTAGRHKQHITWPVADGDWTVVVMNRDGSPGVAVSTAAGAEVPAMPWAIGILISLGGVALVMSVLFISVPVRAAGRTAARTQ